MYRRAGLALVVVAVCLTAPGRAWSQQTEPAPATPAERGGAPAELRRTPGDPRETPEALRARLDSLRPLVEEARAAAARRDARTAEDRRRAAAVETRVDTLRVGPLRVLTPEDQAAVTREVVSAVWDDHFAGLGDSPALRQALFVFQWTDDPEPVHVDGGASHRLTLDRWTRRARVDAAVRDLIGQAMAADLAPDASAVGGWLASNPFQAGPWDRIYRKVATTHARVTRACLAGDPAACGSALGLGAERSAAQLEAWYEPEERRALVAEAVHVDSRRWGAQRQRCLDEGVGCDGLLLAYPYGRWTPLGPDVRRTLVMLALEVGGPGSWSRLLEDPSMTPTEALEHASGLPMADLLDRWRARLVAGRPDTFEGLIPQTGLTLVWTLFFAALAMRSTRWRLG